MNRGEAVGHAIAGIIVGVNSHPCCGKRFLHLPENFRHGPKIRSAVGITQDKVVRACRMGGPQSGQGIGGIGLESVKKMLRVVNHLFAAPVEVGNRIGDHVQVLLQRRFQRGGHMERRTFPKNGHDSGVCLQQHSQIVVLLRGRIFFPRTAESSDANVFQRDVLDGPEEVYVLGIGTGPAAFQVIKAQFIELLGNAHLIVNRKRHPASLGAVAQGCVINQDVCFLHFLSPVGPHVAPVTGFCDGTRAVANRSGFRLPGHNSFILC